MSLATHHPHILKEGRAVPKANNTSAVKPSGSSKVSQTKPDIVSQKSNITKNPSSSYNKSYIGSPPVGSNDRNLKQMSKGFTGGYVDPPTHLNEGINRKLYSNLTKPSVNPQSHIRKGRSTPPHSYRGENLMFLDTSNHDFQSNPALEKIFRPMMEQDRQATEMVYERQTTQVPQYLHNTQQLPLHTSSTLRSTQSFRANNSYLQGISDGKVQGDLQTTPDTDDSTMSEDVLGKYTLAKEIITPKSKFSSMKTNPTLNYPRLEDTKKMRNPMFSAFDFSTVDSNCSNTKSRFKPEDYSYTEINPVAPKEYVKAHAAPIAKAVSDDLPYSGFQSDRYGSRFRNEASRTNIGLDIKSQIFAQPKVYPTTEKASDKLSYSNSYSIQQPILPTGVSGKGMIAHSSSLNSSPIQPKRDLFERADYAKYGRSALNYGTKINYPW